MQPKKLFIIATVAFILSLCFVNGLFAVWNKALPADNTVFRVADDLIRANNDAIETALDAEHYFATGGTQTGAHRPGGASILRYETTATIDADIVTTGIYVHDGLIFDTTLNQFFTMDAAATAKVAMVLGPEAIAGAILDEDNMATDSATKVPSQQSVKAFVTSGTVTMTNKTLIDAVLTSPLINGSLDPLTSSVFLDEDDMASDDAGKIPSQQSVKAYVDTQVATHGFYISNSSVYSATPTSNVWTALDLSAAGTPAIGANQVVVLLKVNGQAGSVFKISTSETPGAAVVYHSGYAGPNGLTFTSTSDNANFTIVTDAAGKVYFGSNTGAVTITLVGYIK